MVVDVEFVVVVSTLLTKRKFPDSFKENEVRAGKDEFEIAESKVNVTAVPEELTAHDEICGATALALEPRKTTESEIKISTEVNTPTLGFPANLI